MPSVRIPHPLQDPDQAMYVSGLAFVLCAGFRCVASSLLRPFVQERTHPPFVPSLRTFSTRFCLILHSALLVSRMTAAPWHPLSVLNSDSVRSEIMLFDPRRRERRRELGVRILEWIALQELKVRGPYPLLQSGCLHKRFPCAKNAVPVTFVSRGDKSLVGRVCWIYNGRGPRIPSSSLAERDNHSSWNCRSSGQGSHEVGCVIAKACVRA